MDGYREGMPLMNTMIFCNINQDIMLLLCLLLVTQAKSYMVLEVMTLRG